MEILLDEVESLEAILMDDVTIVRHPESGFPEVIETTVLPTVGGDVDRQYVCVTLQVMPTEGYPDTKPQFKLRNPRGLSDSSINAIEEAMRKKLDECLGQPVVFDLIEIIREHLTDSNLPSGQCVVCLFGFQEGDEFTKTPCYHYLHSYCLARHLSASRRNYQEEYDKLPGWQKKQAKPYQATCPVCRESISDDVEEPLGCAQPPMELENAPHFQLTDEIRELQAKMAELFLRQKIRGGIIDVDADEGNVISIDNDDEGTEGHKTSDTSPDEPPAEQPQTPTRRGQQNYPHQRGITRSSHQRTHHGGNHHSYRRNNRNRRAGPGRDQPCGSHPR
ncbi:E3 ubiquitin-protein ligase RNF25 [Lutzomyia longipalpis]|uniref:E3 ubiquitin-protein ligase RNF25 n=1 Tax=Lutzomyia longipalpis TaxID=7200 RepID=UPI002483BDED|nr:E3 ubiquitin-protein ligase RNF25 [Lutzomyia longipalpis]